MSPEEQLAIFKAGVDLFGSVEAAARWMEINPRTLRYLLNRRRALHDGHCRALADALLALATEARAIERQISPAFSANLTQDQRTKAPHGNRFDQRDLRSSRAASSEAETRPSRDDRFDVKEQANG